MLFIFKPHVYHGCKLIKRREMDQKHLFLEFPAALATWVFIHRCPSIVPRQGLVLPIIRNMPLPC